MPTPTPRPPAKTIRRFPWELFFLQAPIQPPQGASSRSQRDIHARVWHACATHRHKISYPPPEGRPPSRPPPKTSVHAAAQGGASVDVGGLHAALAFGAIRVLITRNREKIGLGSARVFTLVGCRIWIAARSALRPPRVRRAACEEHAGDGCRSRPGPPHERASAGGRAPHRQFAIHPGFSSPNDAPRPAAR